MSLRTVALCAMTGLSIGVGNLSAQTPASPAPSGAPASLIRFEATRASAGIKVDGVLDEDSWRTATVIPLPYEWAPGDNATPPVATECLVTYDREHLYVAFRSHDANPRAIRAHLMDRDDTDTLIQDDHVGFTIDTFNDERRGFQFRINPMGVQADAIFSEQDGIEDFSWDMLWDAAGRITDDGYVVETALPLKQLRFSNGDAPQTWGFEAFRSWPRNVRHRMTSRWTDRNKGCVLCQENKIDGFQGLEPGRNVELDPTATFGRTDTRASSESKGLSTGDIDKAAGLSGRWSLTPNWTLNGTINPDFSQIEADVAQLDVNTRFALYYAEKRPFFLEGADFFATPLPTVFTRTVADPDFGVKLTGKQGPHLAGVFVTKDQINNLQFPSNEGTDSTSLNDEVVGTVARYRMDLGQGSTIGALYAGREGRDYFNRQAGLDTFVRLSGSDQVRLQVLHSETQYPAAVAASYGQRAASFGGDAVYFDAQHVSRNWVGYASLESYSPGFRSDSGYIPRVDHRQVYLEGARRFWRSGGSWFDRITLGMRGWRAVTCDWDLREQTVAAFLNYTGPYQSAVIFNMPRDIVVYGGQRFEYWRPNFSVSVKPSGHTNFTITGRAGGGVDYGNAKTATSVLELNPSIEYRPFKRVSLGLSHNLEQLSVDEGRLYRANLTQVKALYHLNVRTFVRVILQYTDITRAPELYTYTVTDHTRRLFSQYLFSYKLNPQTVLFAGYSDTSAGTAAAAQSIDLQRQSRTFFVKLGWAWVM
jgi:hypothetical protein